MYLHLGGPEDNGEPDGDMSVYRRSFHLEHTGSMAKVLVREMFSKPMDSS